MCSSKQIIWLIGNIINNKSKSGHALPKRKVRVKEIVPQKRVHKINSINLNGFFNSFFI